MKNVIILGPGRTGSSVLAGLISYKNRFYINKDSIDSRSFYPDGDYENTELRDLNKKIFYAIGYKHEKVEPGSYPDVRMIEEFSYSGSIEKYKNFVVKCEKNSPWLWKDPRLAYTIFFWKKFLDLENINFILIDRDKKDVFRSFSKKYIKYTKKEVFEKYDDQMKSINTFFKKNDIDYLYINYKEFHCVENIIFKLNKFLETNITLKDYNDIYKNNIKNKKENYIKFYMNYIFRWIRIKMSKFFKYKK